MLPGRLFLSARRREYACFKLISFICSILQLVPTGAHFHVCIVHPTVSTAYAEISKNHCVHTHPASLSRSCRALRPLPTATNKREREPAPMLSPNRDPECRFHLRASSIRGAW